MRIYFVYGIIFVVGVLIAWKVFTIQQYKDDFWIKKSETLSTKHFTVPAERGNIYSSDDRLLATSLPYFDVYVDFGAEGMSQELFDKNIDALSSKLASTFKDNSAETYKRKLVLARKARKRYFPIKKNVDYALMKEMQTWPLFSAGKYKGGLIPEMHQKRKNPYELLAKRTIGYTRKNAQSIGLEASYDKQLGGTDGRMLKQLLAGGVWMPIKGATSSEPKNGNDIISTIHINIQDVAEAALMEALVETSAEFGCAVVMEVKTGAIRAMANLGRTQDGGLHEISNYAIAHRAEPGSTFKLASYLALLEDGYIKTSDTINIGGGQWSFQGNIMRDDHITDGFLSVKEAFARSSNVAIARLVSRHYKGKKTAFYQKLVAFGLTEPTGIDIEGEASPILRTPKNWSGLTLPWMSTGYEIMLTPIQVLAFYNAVANDGVWMKPHLVEKIIDNGKVVENIAPQAAPKAIASENAIGNAHFLLRQVVEHPKGTARGISSSYFPLAGKTGTAKLRSIGEKGYSSSNQAMFAGFFPANEPVYSCVVMIYNPQGPARTGGSAAAPVFKAIAEKALARDLKNAPVANIKLEKKSVPTTQVKGDVQQLKSLLGNYGYEFQVGDDINYVSVKVDKSAMKIVPTSTDEAVMPDLIGMTFDDAIYLLENAGLKIRYEGIGKVYAQSIQPGAKVKKGEIVKVKMKTKA